MKLANTPQTVINIKSTGTLISGVKTKYEEEMVAQLAYPQWLWPLSRSDVSTLPLKHQLPTQHQHRILSHLPQTVPPPHKTTMQNTLLNTINNTSSPQTNQCRTLAHIP
jgi:hypothetical protein